MFRESAIKIWIQAGDVTRTFADLASLYHFSLQNLYSGHQLFIGDSDAAEYMEKYNKYEAEYVRRVKAKYFSGKSLHGGNIFDKATEVDNEVILGSKTPSTKSFTDGPRLGEEHKSSASVADPSGNAQNKKSQSRKNG